MGRFFFHLNGLNNDYNQDLSYHEEEIAKNLDDILQNYSKQLMNKPIQSLFNIFNHKKRNLTKFDLAYELIKNQYNESNDLNIFILLTTLDGTKISEENLNESISMKDDRLGFTPTIKTSYLKRAIEKQEILKQQANELMLMFKFINSKFEEEKEKTAEILANHKIELADMRDKFMIEIKSLNEIIEKQKNDASILNKNSENEINELKQKIENQKNEISLLNENYLNKIKLLCIENENQKKLIPNNSVYSFFSDYSIDEQGILNKLKNVEKNWQDPLFIASQSSCDVYNLIDPNTKDCFDFASKNNFVEFEIPESITIIGFKVFSSIEYYPKSFDIEIEGKAVKSIKDAKELNGEFREMNIDIEPTKGQIIRIINKGKCWDKNSCHINIKQIEILSSEAKYSKGVFATLIKSNEKRDPHKCDVHITSYNFDFNSFHMIDASNNIGTFDYEDSWFQIELTKGTAIISGFRLKKGNSYKLKNFKLVGTDDINKPIDQWSVLIEINEKTEDDHEQLDIYKLSKPSPPIKFIRLVQTGKNWSNDNFLVLYHLDFFGYYF